MTNRAFLTSALALAFAVPAGAADAFLVDKAHSEVTFQVTHLGISKVRGKFREFDGQFQLDAAKPEASTVQFTIKTASVDTGNENRDADLRSGEGFFEVEKHPTITFKSTRVQPKGKDAYDVTGEFTMHGVTRTLTLPVRVAGPITDHRGATKYGFETETTLNRKDYGLTWHNVMDTGGLVVSDEVKVAIQLEVSKPKAQ
ncbi:MAG TPA: YceI family protein [Vicinamibacteria bacterium]|nr:YceI family protein [Vicinamibacteria bacterium]